LSDSSFTDNTATNQTGGAVFLKNESAVISGCTFNDNSAYHHGGAVRIQTTSITDAIAVSISSCSFDTNSAGAAGYGYGGSIFLDTWSSGYGGFATTISDTSITNSTASIGGGVYGVSSSDPASVLFTNCTLSGNTADYASEDAAIGMAGSGMVMSMASCTACDHAYGYEIDGDVSDLGGNDLGGWCCPGDVDDDWDVDTDDLLHIISETWGDTGTEDVQDDVDRDGVVAVSDLIHVLRNWGSCD
jgi:predicted outer membrane repeat protein